MLLQVPRHLPLPLLLLLPPHRIAADPLGQPPAVIDPRRQPVPGHQLL